MYFLFCVNEKQQKPTQNSELIKFQFFQVNLNLLNLHKQYLTSQ